MYSFSRKMILLSLLTVSSLNAAVLSVDVSDNENGIQNTIRLKDNVDTLIFSFYLQNAVNCFSYQFSVQFDTTRLRFITSDIDKGISGPANILKSNGGDVVGLSQLRNSNSAGNIIDFGCTISGQNQSRSVSGSGLAGIAVFKNLMSNNDSTIITLLDCFTASFNGQKTAIDSLKSGKVATEYQSTANKMKSQFTQDKGKLKISINNNHELVFASAVALHDATIIITDISGRITGRNFIPFINGPAVSSMKLRSGTYVVMIKCREIILTRKFAY
jgi:hypothetical protein